MAQDSGSIYSEIRIELDKLKSDVKKANDQFDKFGKQNKKDSDSVNKNWTKAFSKLNLAGVASIAAVTLAFKKAVTTFAATEQALANVRAVTQATDADFRRLQEAANDAGETTRFSASQAADALYFLASAGFDATQSIESLDGVLLLAGATGSDLASTAATMTAAISQYGLEASDAERVSNVFAAAIGNSQANMEKLSSAFRQAGPIAGTLGISLEETTASLQALFNAGFQGEQAGTALRSILLDLSDSTSPVIEKLEKAGVAFDDVNPKTVGLTQAMETLAASGVDLGAVFGKVAAGQVLTLAKAATDTEGNLRDLESAVTGTNSAAEQYAIQNDTLAGSIDQFKSKLEAFGNSVIQRISPGLRSLIDLGGKLLSFLTNANRVAEGSRILQQTQKDLREQVNFLREDIPGLIDEYYNLAENQFLTNEQSARQEEIGARLLELIPDLTEADLENAAATEARFKNTEALNRELAKENYNNLIKQREGLRKAEEELSKEISNRGSNAGVVAKVQDAALAELQNLIIDISVQIGEASKALNEQGSELLDVTEIMKRYREQYQKTKEDVEELNDTIEETGDSASSATSGLTEYEKILLDLIKERDSLALSAEELAKKERELFKANLESLDITQEEIDKAIALYDERSNLIKQKEDEAKALQKELEAQKIRNSNLEQYSNLEKDLKNDIDALKLSEEELAEKERDLFKANLISLGIAEDQINKTLALYDERVKLNKQKDDELKKLKEEEKAQNEKNKQLKEYNQIFEKLRDSLDELTLSESELAEKERDRFIANLESLKITDEQLKLALELYDQNQLTIKQQEEALEAELKAKESAEEYLDIKSRLQSEINKLTLSESELAKIERDRFVKSLESLNLTKEEIESAIELYDRKQDLINAEKELITVQTKNLEIRKKSKEVSKENIRQISQEGQKLIEIIDLVAQSITGLDLANATSEDIVKNLAETTSNVLSSIPNAYTQLAASIINVGVAIFDIIEGIIEFGEEFEKAIENIEASVEQQLFKNQKTALDQRYDAEIQRLKDLKDQRISIFESTLSEEEKLALRSAGYLEETEKQRLERERAEAKKNNDLEAVALIDNALKLAKIESDIAAEKQKAEKEYALAVAKYDREKAEFDKEIAVTKANIDLQNALSGLPWYASKSDREELKSVYANLVSAIQSQPLPTIPQFQTGGIVLGSGSSDTGRIVNVAENGSSELLLNNSQAGQAMLSEFANAIADRLNSNGSVTLIQNNTVNTDTLANIDRAARLLAPALKRGEKRSGTTA